MNVHKPEIRRLDAGYCTPEWQYAINDFSPFVTWAVGVPFYAAWAWLVCWHNPFGWIPGERLVAAIAGVAGAYVIATAINRALQQKGGGYGLAPGGPARLRAEFARGRFRVQLHSRWQIFDARVPHTFAMREHRLRYEEGRAEERARADGFGQRPDYYRRAWEIVLDYGRTRIILAAIADEETARAIIRKLHKLDEFSRGSEGAGTATGSDSAVQTTPSGNRPKLD